MKKYTIAVVLAFLMFLGLFALPVLAENSVVTYYGIKEGFTFAPGSGYADTDLFDGFKGVMPGDRLTETIIIKNKARDCDYIRLYMRAEVHDETENPLSPGVAAAGETVESMKNFLSQLSMQVWQGSRQIYEGTPDISDGLSRYVSLGEFQKGETAELTVYLDVPQELGNEFQHRTGEVDWIFAVEAFDYPQPPPTVDRYLTVHKVWSKDDPEKRPEEITVQLLRNGKLYDEVELNSENQWTYTWDHLALLQEWSVVEAEVPNGYEATYDVRGTLTIITNRWKDDGKEPVPEEPAVPEIPPEEPVVPEIPPEEPADPEIPPEEPADPEIPPEEPVVPEIPPEEPTIPEIPPKEYICLTAQKLWSGDEKTPEKRPDAIGVTLYNGDTAVETVWLSESNAWTFTWTDLDAAGEWSVMENDIPNGYTPSYRAERTEQGKFVKITNTSSLLQTGQLNWPVPFLLFAGLLFVVVGVILIKKKKKEKDRA